MTAQPVANRTALQSVMTGNIIKVEFGGKLVGIIQSVNAQDDYGLQPISGVGRNTAYENAPGFARFSLTVDTIFLFPGLITGTTSLTEEAGGDQLVNFEDADIAPGVAEDILRGIVIDIVIRTKGGKELFRYKWCSYGGGSFGIQKHVAVSRSAQFLAIDKQYPGKVSSKPFAA
jgi:hypothetical protein